MPRDGFDISVLGIPELEKKFKRLDRVTQGKILRPVIREGVKRAKARMVANLSGDPVEVRTGVTLAAFRKAPVRSASRSRSFIKLAVRLPTREDLGIPQNAKHYYPMAIEFGHKRARARPFMRPAIDQDANQEIRIMGAEIGARMRKMLKKR